MMAWVLQSAVNSWSISSSIANEVSAKGLKSDALASASR